MYGICGGSESDVTRPIHNHIPYRSFWRIPPMQMRIDWSIVMKPWHIYNQLMCFSIYYTFSWMHFPFIQIEFEWSIFSIIRSLTWNWTVWTMMMRKKTMRFCICEYWLQAKTWIKKRQRIMIWYGSFFSLRLQIQNNRHKHHTTFIHSSFVQTSYDIISHFAIVSDAWCFCMQCAYMFVICTTVPQSKTVTFHFSFPFRNLQ